MAEARPRRVLPAAIGMLVALSTVFAGILAVDGIRNYLRESAPKELPAVLTAKARTQQLTDAISGPVSVSSNWSWVLKGSGVVTRPGVAAGTEVHEGQVVAYLAERPIIVMQGKLPMFRPLGPGDTGRDVAALQSALSRIGYHIDDATGSYAESTGKAVYRLYTKRRLTPVTKSGQPVDADSANTAGVPAAELVFVPALPAVAVTACGAIGQEAAGELCRVQAPTGTPAVTLPLGDAARVTADAAVDIAWLDGSRTAGTVARVEPPPTGNTKATTQRVLLNLAVSPSTSATGQGTITLAKSAPDSVVIEAKALRENAQGETSLERRDGVRQPVKVGICVRGLCEIISGASAGQEFVLTGPTP